MSNIKPIRHTVYGRQVDEYPIPVILTNQDSTVEGAIDISIAGLTGIADISATVYRVSSPTGSVTSYSKINPELYNANLLSYTYTGVGDGRQRINWRFDAAGVTGVQQGRQYGVSFKVNQTAPLSQNIAYQPELIIKISNDIDWTGLTGTDGSSMFGITGPTGETGPFGPAGMTGSVGPQGAQGITGASPTGQQGIQGLQGQTGYEGITGEPGQTGSIGPIGNQGSIGLTGYGGITGSDGPTGLIGPQGAQGSVGLTGFGGITGASSIGSTGPQGETGSAGTYGFTGRQGITGLQGAQGIEGQTGIQGIQGLKGDTGAVGSTGLLGGQGTKGDTGSQGLTGVGGIAGSQGSTGLGVTGLANFLQTSLPNATTTVPTLLWDLASEALYAQVTGIGHWVQISAGAQAGATGIVGAQGTQGQTGVGVTGPIGIQGSQGQTGAGTPAGSTGSFSSLFTTLRSSIGGVSTFNENIPRNAAVPVLDVIQAASPSIMISTGPDYGDKHTVIGLDSVANVGYITASKPGTANYPFDLNDHFRIGYSNGVLHASLYDAGRLDLGIVPTPGFNYRIAFEGTTPGSITGCAAIYAKTAGAATELYARDGQNNETLLSPHHFDETHQSTSSSPYPWTYYSRNEEIGWEVWVDMSAVVEDLEELTGKQYAFYKKIEKTEIKEVDNELPNESV